jgi:hypothetical protein
MHLITLALILLLLAAGPVAASATPPTPSSVVPWSARCYTDTCGGFRVTFAGGHAVALGHAGDNPDDWAIFDGDQLTADEAAFIEATVSALVRHDLPRLAVAYPALPPWYMDALATYLAPDRPVYQRWLPLVVR